MSEQAVAPNGSPVVTGPATEKKVRKPRSDKGQKRGPRKPKAAAATTEG